MSRRYQLRSFSLVGTRLRGHFTNLDWKTLAHAGATLHAGFDIEVSDLPPFDVGSNARDLAIRLIAFLKEQGALLPDAETDLSPGLGEVPIRTFLDSLPDLPDFG